MPRSLPLRTIGLALLAAATAGVAVADRVRLREGGSISGEIVEESSRSLSVKDIDGRTRQTPVDEVRSVLIEGEPISVTQARARSEAGGYEAALATLDDLGTATISDKRLLAEVAYLRAVCAARLAEAGQGSAAEAGGQLTAFLRAHPDSWRATSAIRALGDLLVSAGRYDQAVKMYGRMAQAGPPSMKREAAVLAASALAAGGDHARAIELLDRVLDAEQQLDATGRLALARKARCLAAQDQLDAAVDLARRLVREADDADAASVAQGYNTLGHVYEEVDRPVDAVLAYLHTDLLFPSDEATHAEALARLATLLREIGKPDAADDARQRLRSEYASSRWARRAEQPN